VLAAAVSHLGTGASCGHFTAAVASDAPSGGGRVWHHFDDSTVRLLPGGMAGAAGAALRRDCYLLFYECNDAEAEG
jgi:ubiquitin C-terminal hydrolase